MDKYFRIPDKILRKLAKVKGITNIRGKSNSDIINAIESAGHIRDLEHLQKEFSFTKNNGGLIIERPLIAYPEETNTPEKFLSRLIERELLPAEFQNENQWRPRLEGGVKICGLYHDGDVVFLNLVQTKYSSRKTGWGVSDPEPYADITPVAIQFGENAFIQYRATQQTNIKQFVMDLLGYQGDVQFENVTKVSNADANAIKAALQAIYSSEHLALPSTVGSIRINSSKGKYDLENDLFAGELRAFLENHNYPSDDRMDVTCHLENYKDIVTEVEFPVTFDIHIKSGTFKFKSLVTQSAIDHIVEAIIQVCYISKQKKPDEAEEVMS